MSASIIVMLLTTSQERNYFTTYPLLYILGAGLIFPLIQLLGTVAQQKGKIGTITLMNYMLIPLIFLVDIFIFKEKFNDQ